MGLRRRLVRPVAVVEDEVLHDPVPFSFLDDGGLLKIENRIPSPILPGEA
jgi:hypothetical protein